MTANKSQSNQNAWTWKAVGDVPPAKGPMNIKVKATIQATATALIGWAVFHFLHHRIVPIIIWSISGLVLIGGWFIPVVFHGIEHFGQWLAKWVTRILNWVLLVPFYFLCFLPGRIILKIRGIDPMDREFPSGRETFWIPRKPVTDMKQYRKQH